MNPYSDCKLGVIEEQAYAELVVMDGDPFVDITSLKRDKIKMVLKDGKYYKYTLRDDALEVVNK
jgi:imidazolonepropionase-like amidohydrolase